MEREIPATKDIVKAAWIDLSLGVRKERGKVTDSTNSPSWKGPWKITWSNRVSTLLIYTLPMKKPRGFNDLPKATEPRLQPPQFLKRELSFSSAQIHGHFALEKGDSQLPVPQNLTKPTLVGGLCLPKLIAGLSFQQDPDYHETI